MMSGVFNMSIFNFITDIFKPAKEIIDEFHFSGEEQGNIEIEKQKIEVKKIELQNKLAEIESSIGLKMLDLQYKISELTSKIAISEQQFGNWLSKSWRPLVSIMFAVQLELMAFKVVEFNVVLAGIAGSFLGVYVPLRSWEKKK